MYYEYWGMGKHPFNNVPDPEMYFEMHSSVENTIAEVLFAIEEGDECLAVIVGDVGVGKTMALRIILTSLDLEAYRIAFITNPDLTFPQLLREIVGQLNGVPCKIHRREALLDEFNKLLFEAADAGKRTLIFIDEANALRPVNLQSLRLLTNMQEDDRNLFTIILAGQTELAKRLEHPRARNLFQRIGVYCRIEKLESRALMRDYVEHRMELVGCTRPVFTQGAYDELWTYSEQGIPRLINKLCKLALKAGQTNGLERIGPEVIRTVGERFKRITEKRPRRTRSRKVQAPQEEGADVSDEHPDVAFVEPEGGNNGNRGIHQLKEAVSELAFSQTNPFLSIRPVDPDGNIVYRRRRYYVGPELAGQNVTVSEMEGQLFVRSGEQLMMLPIGSGQSEKDPLPAQDYDRVLSTALSQ